jgi:hypothetical protein
MEDGNEVRITALRGEGKEREYQILQDKMKLVEYLKSAQSFD